MINLKVADYYERASTRWLWFQEKRGKEHEVPVHSKAKEAVDLWLERSYLPFLGSNPSAPLFPSFGKNRETIDRDAWIVGGDLLQIGASTSLAYT